MYILRCALKYAKVSDYPIDASTYVSKRAASIVVCIVVRNMLPQLRPCLNSFHNIAV